MLQISEIRDRESLEAWLDALPLDSAAEQAEARRVAVSIAARSAARVLPLQWRWSLTEEARTRYVTALPVLRCCLISSVAAKVPTEDIRRAATTSRAATRAYAVPFTTASASAAGSAYAAAAAAVRATNSASNSAADAVRATTYAATAAATAATADSAAAAAAAAAAIWNAVRSDCDRLVAGQDVFALPLWPDDSPRPGDWPKLRRALLQDGATPEPGDDWRFWIAWYDRMLDPDGHSPDWDLLEEIALIAPEIWDARLAVALPAINAIWARYRMDAVITENPLGLRIDLDERSGKLASAPIEKRDLSLIVKDIRTALREFTRRCKVGAEGGNLGPSILRAFEQTLKDLIRDISKFREDPRELLRVLEETRRSLTLIADTEGFGRDASVDRLIGNIERREEDICIAAPEVMEEVKRRMAFRVQLFSVEQTRAAIRMSTGMLEDSQGLLQSAMMRAILVINDPDCSESEKQAVWTFLLGALPRGARVLQEAGRDCTDVSKKKPLLEKLLGYADKANRADKGIDAVQEAVQEGGPWVTEVYSQIMSGNFWR